MASSIDAQMINIANLLAFTHLAEQPFGFPQLVSEAFPQSGRNHNPKTLGRSLALISKKRCFEPVSGLIPVVCCWISDLSIFVIAQLPSIITYFKHNLHVNELEIYQNLHTHYYPKIRIEMSGCFIIKSSQSCGTSEMHHLPHLWAKCKTCCTLPIVTNIIHKTNLRVLSWISTLAHLWVYGYLILPNTCKLSCPLKKLKNFLVSFRSASSFQEIIAISDHFRVSRS